MADPEKYFLGPDLEDGMNVLLLGTGGSENGFERAALELGFELYRNERGVILGLQSDTPFTEEQVKEVNRIMREEMEAYLESK